MTTITRYPTAVSGTGWTTPTNAQGVPDTTLATYSATLDVTATSELTGATFDFSVIPSFASINSVTLGYRYTMFESRNAYSHNIRAYVSSAAIGSAVTSTGEVGANAGGGDGELADVSGSGGAITTAQLKDGTFQVRANCARASGSRAWAFSLDALWVTVDYYVAYTVAQPESLDLTDSLLRLKGLGPTDSLGLTEAMAKDQTASQIENLGLTETVAKAQARSTTDSLGLADSNDRVLNRIVPTDSLGLGDSYSIVLAAARVPTDTLALTDTCQVLHLRPSGKFVWAYDKFVGGVV